MKVASEAPFQLLLTDVHMPDVDGFTLVETIRENPATADLPVILLTSTHVHEELDQCERLRIAAHVAKPVKQSDLLEAITSSLSRGRVRRLRSRRWTVLPPLPRLRILLAEDSVMNQKLALGLLGADHDVTVAIGWPAGGQPGRAGDVRRRADGCPDAHHGRPGGDAPDPNPGTEYRSSTCRSWR